MPRYPHQRAGARLFRHVGIPLEDAGVAHTVGAPIGDTVIKRAAYARAGESEYWILRPASRDVLVCWLPDTGRADYTNERLFAADMEMISPTLPIRVAVVDLFEPPTCQA